MSHPLGISFLYAFDFGNRGDPDNPGINILSVTETATGDFDKANLTTEPLRQVWRTIDAIGWKEIVIRAETESTIDTVGLLGHNLSPDAVVQVQADYTDSFAVPAESHTMTWSEHNMALTEEFDDDYEFYKIRILDPGNLCGFIEIGRLIGGRAFTFTNNEDITDDFEIGLSDLADVAKSEGFFRISNERVKVQTFKARFSKLSTANGLDANYRGWMAMVREMGITRPFLTIVDRGDPGFGLFWAQLDSIPAVSYTVNRFATLNFSLTEMF